MIRRPPRSTLFPTRRSSDLPAAVVEFLVLRAAAGDAVVFDAGEFPRLIGRQKRAQIDRKSTRLNSSHSQISYAVFCLKKKKQKYTYSVLVHDPSKLNH